MAPSHTFKAWAGGGGRRGRGRGKLQDEGREGTRRHEPPLPGPGPAPEWPTRKSLHTFLSGMNPPRNESRTEPQKTERRKVRLHR